MGGNWSMADQEQPLDLFFLSNLLTSTMTETIEAVVSNVFSDHVPAADHKAFIHSTNQLLRSVHNLNVFPLLSRASDAQESIKQQVITSADDSYDPNSVGSHNKLLNTKGPSPDTPAAASTIKPFWL